MAEERSKAKEVPAEMVVEEFLKITGVHIKELMAMCDIKNYIHGKADFDDEFYIITISRHSKLVTP